MSINNFRCSSKKLRHLLDELSDEKKSIIQHIGFGGLLQLSSTEIRHSLCRWIITHFNIAHCRLDIGQERQFPITCSDVGEILGIPYIGRRLLLSPTNRNNRMENLSDLRDRLILMEDMAEFKKLFIFFSCATLLAPTSKLDGSHELWCTLLAGDFDINVNWGQFVLDTLVAGIRHFRLGKGSWFLSCLIFSDEREEDAHVDPVIQEMKLKKRLLMPIDLTSDITTLYASLWFNIKIIMIEDEVQMNAIIPYETGHPPIRSYRLHRHTTGLQSPYVVQPSIKFSASSFVAKQVLAYALDDTRDESQILCSMHNFFLTRFDLKCLGPDKLVDNKVVTMHCRILNGMDKENRKHFLSPNFVSDVENKRGSLSPKYICDNLWKYFKNTRLCTYEQVNVLSTVIGIQERRPSFMQLWSNRGISRAIANDKVIKYREKLLTQLIMSPENEVRENVYQAMDQ
ncbi:hypothetical protein AAG906_035295 [Vitis piasezkii]